jgi:hypothetical protein
MIFGTELNLPPMSKLERRRILAPVLQAVAETSIKTPGTDPE